MPLNIIMLCGGATVYVGTIIDHINGIVEGSTHRINPVDAAFCSASGLNLDAYDALVIHYSILLSDPTNIPSTLFEKICNFRGLKVAIIHDEHRRIDIQNAAIERLGIGILFTVTNSDVTRRIYRTAYFEKVRIVHSLTGYVSEALLNHKVPEYWERPVDVSYRARRCYAWLGNFAEKKFTIGKKFLADTKDSGLICDIESDESARLYGSAWIDLLSMSKATLGTESGASFVDFTGEIERNAEAFEREHPSLTCASIREMFLQGRDGDIVIHVISPRIFEAIALRTLLVLYPGEYSGVLHPWRHYVPLSEDHSNIDQVVDIIKCADRAQPIIKRAYDEIALNPRWQLKSFVAEFDTILGEEFAKRSARAPYHRSALPATAQELQTQWQLAMRIATTDAQVVSYRKAYEAVEDRLEKCAFEYRNYMLAHRFRLPPFFTMVITTLVRRLRGALRSGFRICSRR